MDVRNENQVRSNLDPRNRSLSGNDPRVKPPEHRTPPPPTAKDEYVPSTIDKYLKSSMSKDEVLAKLKSDLFDQKKDIPPPEVKPPMMSHPPPRRHEEVPSSNAPPRRMFGNPNTEVSIFLILFVFCKFILFIYLF